MKIDLALDDASFAVAIRSEARTTGQTGVEMEALTGAAVAALTVIDMVHHVPKHLPSQPVSTAECRFQGCVPFTAAIATRAACHPFRPPPPTR